MSTGGAYFGVPLRNFAGWYLTVFIFRFLFALHLRQPSTKAPFQQVPGPDGGFWFMAIVLFGAQGLVRVLVSATFTDLPLTDGGGTVWSATDLVQTGALVTFMTKGFVALLAAMSVADACPLKAPAKVPPAD